MLKNAAFCPIWLYTNIVSLSELVGKWHLVSSSIVPTFSFHVNAVEKDSTYERVCNSLDRKCVDKCTYALITILPISKGNVHNQVHNSTIVFLNCEQEEYSLCIFFPLMSTACLPSLLLLTNPDLLHAQQWIDHTYKLIPFLSGPFKYSTLSNSCWGLIEKSARTTTKCLHTSFCSPRNSL